MVEALRVLYISPDELKPNQLNAEIYEKHDDSELEASARALPVNTGVLEILGILAGCSRTSCLFYSEN